MTYTNEEFVREVSQSLLETDALTGNHDGTPEWYTVEAENIEYLVKTVLTIADGLL